MTDSDLLTRIYAALNRRDIETVLATLHAEVDWPSGMEGRRIHGPEGVRLYWVHQWSQINPHVEPKAFRIDSTGAIVVDVHQTVHDMNGKLLADRTVQPPIASKMG